MPQFFILGIAAFSCVLIGRLTVKQMKSLIFCFVMLLTASFTTAAQEEEISILISADMEGIAGAVTWPLGPEGFEYEKLREYMTGEVNAAIKSAKASGATRIVVADSHANGQNILIDRLPKDVLIVRSWPRPLGMMQGIELGKFDGAILIGYHVAVGNTEGVLPHTMGYYPAVRVNGKMISEGELSALIAGHYNVPVIMVSGDEAAVKEMQEAIGPVEGAIVKWAYSSTSVLTRTPEAAYDLIGEKVTAAMQRLKSFKPYKPAGPFYLDMSYTTVSKTETMSYMPGVVQRLDANTIRYVAKDPVELMGYMTAGGH